MEERLFNIVAMFVGFIVFTVKYTRFGDDVPSSDKYHLFADYGENPFENRRHRIPEVLLLNTQKDKQEDIEI